MKIDSVLKNENGLYVQRERKSGRQKGYLVKFYGEIRNCKTCSNEFFTQYALDGIYCSKRCAHLGKKPSEANRIALSKVKWGFKNPNFKGGKVMDCKGYNLIMVPYHPNANGSGYVFEHRLVIEKHLGRYLTKDEIVHHKNHIRSDNRLENLEIMTRSEHTRLHRLEKLAVK